MNKQDIQLLFKYNQWANARILKAASNLTGEQFLAPTSFPHGGLRGTLTHALFAEWVWRRRWEGESPSQRLKPEEFPTFESLRKRWETEEGLLMQFIEKQTDDSLQLPFKYNALDGKPFERIVWQAMAHVVNHGTQHRSEAAALLTDLGHSPGDIDLIVFLNEQA
jgi:uncharacterized damage-inducible protein DinB